jgi:signal transduction histidine kinase
MINFLDNFFLKRRFAIPALIAGVLLLAVISEVNYRRAHSTLVGGIALTDARIGAANLLQLLTDAETAQRGYLLTADPDYLEQLRNAQRQFDQGTQFLAFFRDLRPSGPADVEKIRVTVAAKFAVLDRTIALAQQGKQAEAIALAQSGTGKELMDELRSTFSRQLAEAARLQQGARTLIYDALWFNRLAVLVLSAVLALGLYLHAQQQRKLERERAAYQQQLEQEVAQKTLDSRKLASRLETTREDEKSHLARELHDELGGLLTAAKLTMARIRNKVQAQAQAQNDPDMLERIQHVNHLLNQGIALKRRIIEDLRPSTLTLLGLHVALENLCTQAGDQLAIPVDTDIAPVSLGDDAELAVFRVAQEALTNIGKYAHPSRVTVRLAQRGDTVYLDVVDDGVGFDPKMEKAGQHGLVGMRFRIESHGGTLSVVTAPQQGTQILANLPAKVA